MARKPAKRAPAKAAASKPAVKKSGRRFNPLAAFAEIFPAYKGATRFQDGGYFSPGGDLLWEDHPASTVEVVTEETTVTVGENGETEQTTVTHTEKVSSAPAGEPRQILTAWLKGEVELKHLQVVNYVKEAFGVVKRTKVEVMAYLVDEVALVPAEQVKV